MPRDCRGGDANLSTQKTRRRKAPTQKGRCASRTWFGTNESLATWRLAPRSINGRAAIACVISFHQRGAEPTAGRGGGAARSPSLLASRPYRRHMTTTCMQWTRTTLNHSLERNSVRDARMHCHSVAAVAGPCNQPATPERDHDEGARSVEGDARGNLRRTHTGRRRPASSKDAV